MRKKTKTLLCFLLAAALLLGGGALGKTIWLKIQYYEYPLQYQESVRTWAEAYGLDPLLLDAFIRTESGFDPQAVSEAGARGLTQITEETFSWIKSKTAADEALTFEDLYDPDVSIRFGGYYIKCCLDRYGGDLPTAAAAYHSGWGTVDRLLDNAAYSQDGKKLDVFPYQQMKNYVAKISGAYARYQLLYGPEGEKQ